MEDSSGLGIGISDMILRQMGSRIEVISTKHVGSDFLFYLNVVPAESPSLTHPPIHTRRMSKRKTVLLIDDTKAFHRILKRVVKKKCPEIQVVSLFTGKDLTSGVFSQIQPDLVLLDANMPGRDGYHTALYIREHLHSEVPVIGITGNSLPEDINNFIQCGANEVLVKPVANAELLDVFEKYEVLMRE
jgi:CheY-like chemotaxis protein